MSFDELNEINRLAMNANLQKKNPFKIETKQAR